MINLKNSKIPYSGFMCADCKAHYEACLCKKRTRLVNHKELSIIVRQELGMEMEEDKRYLKRYKE
jgi:DTW domain-containing protein YfiP